MLMTSKVRGWVVDAVVLGGQGVDAMVLVLLGDWAQLLILASCWCASLEVTGDSSSAWAHGPHVGVLD